MLSLRLVALPAVSANSKFSEISHWKPNEHRLFAYSSNHRGMLVFLVDPEFHEEPGQRKPYTKTGNTTLDRLWSFKDRVRFRYDSRLQLHARLAPSKVLRPSSMGLDDVHTQKGISEKKKCTLDIIREGRT